MEKNGIFMTIMTLVVAVIVLGTFALPVINNVNTVEVTEEHEGVYGSNPVQSREYTVGYTEGYFLRSFEEGSTFSTTDPGEDFEGEALPAYLIGKDYLLNMGAIPISYLYLTTDGTNCTYVEISKNSAEDNAANYGLTYTFTSIKDLGYPYTTNVDMNAVTFTGINDDVKIVMVSGYSGNLYFSYIDSLQAPATSAYGISTNYNNISFDSTTNILRINGDVVTEDREKYGCTSSSGTTDADFDGSECKPIPLTYEDGKWYYDGMALTKITHISGGVFQFQSSDGTNTSSIYIRNLILPVDNSSDTGFFMYDPQDVKYLNSDYSMYFLQNDVVTIPTFNSSAAPRFDYPSDVTISAIEQPSGEIASEFRLSLAGDYDRIFTVSVPSSYTAVFSRVPVSLTVAGFIPMPESIVVNTFTSVKGDLVDGQFVESENGSLLKIPSQILTEGTTYNVGADQTYYFGTSDSTTLVKNKAPESADVPDTDKPTFTVNSANAGVYDMTFGTDVQGDAFIIIAATCIYNYAETHNEELNPLIGVVAVMLCIGLICMAVAAWSGRENL